jgi:hypothetical protein
LLVQTSFKLSDAAIFFLLSQLACNLGNFSLKLTEELKLVQKLIELVDDVVLWWLMIRLVPILQILSHQS